jgi:hypothetical protein
MHDLTHFLLFVAYLYDKRMISFCAIYLYFQLFHLFFFRHLEFYRHLYNVTATRILCWLQIVTGYGVQEIKIQAIHQTTKDDQEYNKGPKIQSDVLV